jgi:replicative superfamily II helicase
MVHDKDLKINHYYWATKLEQTNTGEIDSLIVKFTGIFFRDVKEKSGVYYLYELKLHREVDNEELRKILEEQKLRDAEKAHDIKLLEQGDASTSSALINEEKQ